MQLKGSQGPWLGRLIVHPNPTKETPRYLVTNLAREAFSVEHISDALNRAEFTGGSNS